MFTARICKSFFILIIISKCTECDVHIQNSTDHSETNVIANAKILLSKEDWTAQEETKNITYQNQNPILLNLIINLNIVTQPEKLKKRRKNHGKNNRNQTVTKDKTRDKLQHIDSENLASVFQNIKLKMENQRKKRNTVNQLEENHKPKIQNTTEKDGIEDTLMEKIPTIPMPDEDANVSRWLKNWKDLLAIDPVLKTEKPTEPETKYIDEWRYSYRVTLYNSDEYNISNFVCSGLLVSPRWVLTSMACKLGEDITLLIGVHNLPKAMLEHNRYRALNKVYSLKENLELIQMDRPVEWKFSMPDIGSVKMDQMKNLLNRRRCRLVSWVPVDLDKNIFELRQYPRLVFQPVDRRNPTKNSISVSPSQHYRISKQDTGSPVVCDDLIVGVVLDVDELEDFMTVELLCPVMEWVTFFTKERAYFEVAARKITMKNKTYALRSNGALLLISLLFLSSLEMKG